MLFTRNYSELMENTLEWVKNGRRRAIRKHWALGGQMRA